MATRIVASCSSLCLRQPAHPFRVATFHSTLAPILAARCLPVAAHLSTKTSPFESKQSRLSAPLPSTSAHNPSASASASPPAQPSQPAASSFYAASSTYSAPASQFIENVTQPTPMEYLMYLAVTILSLLAGASVVHNIYKPDMTLPAVKVVQPAQTTTDASSLQPSAAETLHKPAGSLHPDAAAKVVGKS